MRFLNTTPAHEPTLMTSARPCEGASQFSGNKVVQSRRWRRFGKER
jgi:hypothetical protein